jgi:hypothetical protein
MILLQLKPLAALRVRGLILTAIAALVLVAHGCHGDDVDHELGVPVSRQSQSQDPPPCPD